MNESRSSASIPYSSSVSTISNTSGDKTTLAEDQAKKKGIPLTLSAQVNKIFF